MSGQSLRKEISLVPNPATNKVQILGMPDGASVTLYNTMGQEIYTQPNSSEINLSGFAKGVYRVKVSANGTSQVKNLVVE